MNLGGLKKLETAGEVVRVGYHERPIRQWLLTEELRSEGEQSLKARSVYTWRPISITALHGAAYLTAGVSVFSGATERSSADPRRRRNACLRLQRLRSKDVAAAFNDASAG